MQKNVLFAGTPQFAVPCLQELANCGQLNIVAVLTQPDRRQGRGRTIVESPVKKYAQAAGLNVLQFERLGPQAVEQIRTLNVQLIVVVAYGLLLPKQLLAIPELGSVNVHASLLPRWRGAAPIARAIEAGDSVTGISLMQVSERLDAGAVFCQAEEKINFDDTTETLENRLSELGARVLIKQLPTIVGGTAKTVPQDESKMNYARRLEAAEAAIDWNISADEIQRKIRALIPWPIARSWLEDKQLMIWDAMSLGNVTTEAEPGVVVEANRKQLVIATQSGCIQVNEIQRAGKKRMPIANFLAGNPISSGMRLTARPTVQ